MPVRLVARPARLEMVTMRPVPFVFIAGRDRLDEQERALEVGIDDGVEILRAHLFQRPGPLAAHAARDIDQDIGAAGHAHDLGNGGLVGDVDLGSDDLAAAVDAAGKGCDIIDQQVASDDARAVIGQRPRDGLADAARGSGHDRGASVEPDQHGLGSLRWFSSVLSRRFPSGARSRQAKSPPQATDRDRSATSAIP